MPCNDGRGARRSVGRKRQKPDERTGKKKKPYMTVPLFPEIEPHQLVAAKLKDISATVRMADFCSLIIGIHYRDMNSSSFLDNLG